MGLTVDSANAGFTAERIIVKNHAVLYDVVDSWYPVFQNFIGWYFKSAGVRVRNSAILAGSQSFDRFLVTNLGVTGAVDATAAAMLITGSGGVNASHGDLSASPIGLYLHNAAAQAISYATFDDVKADSNTLFGIVLDASAGVSIVSTHFTNCWAAYNGWNGAAFVGAAHGLWLQGGTIDGVSWTGGRLRENGGSGAVINAGTNISIHDAEVAQNSQTVTNTYNGIQMDISSGTVSLVGNRIGNFASSFANVQAFGIIVNPFAGTADNLTIVGNDLRGNNAGPLFWGSVGSQVVMSNNLGVDDVIGSVAAAANIVLPLNPVITITGNAAAISTMTPAWNGRNVHLIFTDAAPAGLTTGGNVARVQVAVQNQAIDLVFNGVWY